MLVRIIVVGVGFVGPARDRRGRGLIQARVGEQTDELRIPMKSATDTD
jgi:hypothetical protein